MIRYELGKMYEVFVGAEGYCLSTRFIVKELSILSDDDEFDHFILSKPVDYQCTPADSVTINYVSRYINSLSFEDGDISYDILPTIIGKLKNHRIYCYGRITQKMLQSYLPTTTVIDIQEMGYRMEKTLLPRSCGRNHPSRFCSLSKAYAIKQFIKK